MSLTIMAATWAAPGLSHTHKIVLLALADNANDAGVCWPAIPNIARRCSLDERSVYRAITALEKVGHLTTEARPGRSTIYRVHPLNSTPDRLSSPPLTQSQGSPLTRSQVTPDTESGTPDRLSPESLKNPKRTSEGRGAARPRSRRVPFDFVVTDDMLDWAEREAPGVDIDAETRKFHDHEFESPKSDWAACWRQWMRRAPEFKPRNGSRLEDTGWKPDPNDPRYVPLAERAAK